MGHKIKNVRLNAGHSLVITVDPFFFFFWMLLILIHIMHSFIFVKLEFHF